MKKLLALTLLFITFSCTQTNRYFLTFENIGSVTETLPVLINGHRVGDIEDIKILRNYKVLVIVKMKEDVPIPVDSEIVTDSDLFGSNSIKIRPGESSTFFSSGDSINVKVGSSTNRSPGIQNFLTSFVQNFFVNRDSLQRTQDSILIELRKLNENLERLSK
jgi:ABC-type transporter Mla subunit MlaD